MFASVPGGPPGLLGIAMVFAGLIAFLHAILLTTLLGKYQKAFRRCLAEAREFVGG